MSQFGRFLSMRTTEMAFGAKPTLISRRPRRIVAGRRSYWSFRQRSHIMAQFLQRRVDSDNGRVFDVERDDALFYSRLPAVAEFMCYDRWENGEKRETTTFMLFFEDGAFKVWVHDRAMKRSAFVSGRSFQDVWECVEAGLAKDCLVWRPDREGGRKK